MVTTVWGFNKVQQRTLKTIDTCELKLPSIRMDSEAIWFDVDEATKVSVSRFWLAVFQPLVCLAQANIEAQGWNLTGGIHAACHLLLAW